MEQIVARLMTDGVMSPREYCDSNADVGSTHLRPDQILIDDRHEMRLRIRVPHGDQIIYVEYVMPPDVLLTMMKAYHDSTIDTLTKQHNAQWGSLISTLNGTRATLEQERIVHAETRHHLDRLLSRSDKNADLYTDL